MVVGPKSSVSLVKSSPNESSFLNVMGVQPLLLKRPRLLPLKVPSRSSAPNIS